MFNRILSSPPKWLLLFVGLLFCVPYLQSFYSPPVAHFFHEWFAAVLGVLICLVAFIQHQVQLSRTSLWLLGLVALIGAQFFIHPPVYAASVVGPMIYLLGAWLMMTAGATLRQHYTLNTLMIWIAWFALLASFVQACFGLLQLIGTPDWLTQVIAQPKGSFAGLMGNMRQQNHFADQVTFGLMAGVYLLASHQISKKVFIPLSVFILSALALSGSRSVFAYFSVALLLTMLWYFVATEISIKQALKRILLILCLLLIVFTALQFILPLIPQLFTHDVTSAASSTNAATLSVVTTVQRATSSVDTFGLGVRVELWKTAITAFLAHPLLGLGLDSFAVLTWRTDQGGLMGYTMHSHNLLTEIAMSLGFFGLALLLIYFIYLAKNFWQQSNTLALWPVLMMMSVMGIHALLELPFWYLHFLLPFALLAGLTEEQTNHHIAWVKPVALFAVVLMAILLLNTSKSYALITSTIKTQVPFQVMQRLYVDAGKNPLMKPLAESILNDYLPANEADLAKKLRLSQKVMEWRPYPRAIFKHAVLLALSGKTDQGEAVFFSALKAYPEASAMPAKMYCRTDSSVATKEILQAWIAKYQNGYLPTCSALIAR